MVAAAHLRAENYSIKPDKMSDAELAQKAASVAVIEFKAKEIKIATTDAEGKFCDVFCSDFFLFTKTWVISFNFADFFFEIFKK